MPKDNLFVLWNTTKKPRSKERGFLEAPPGFEPGIKALQASALPLGYSAITWWLDQESNQGHKDFQSFALPTELSSHVT